MAATGNGFYINSAAEHEEKVKKEVYCGSCWNVGDWKQLKIWAWKPILDETYVIVILFAITALFLPVALYIKHENDHVHEFSVRYDNVGDCTFPDQGQFPGYCDVVLEIEDDMTPPIFFYYELRGFYQSHKRMVQSRYEKQLRGETSAVDQDCDPVQKGVDGKNLMPCGLIAYSFMNDKFKARVEKPENNGFIDLCPDCNDVHERWTSQYWSGHDIAWAEDKEKYKAQELAEDETNQTDLGRRQNLTLPNIEDEDLLVWMRVAISANFKKLHRKVIVMEGDEERGLKRGDRLHVTVASYFPVGDFEGEKHVVVSDVSRLGGRNKGLWVLYLSTGILSGIAGAIFLFTFYKHVEGEERQRRSGHK